jgi:hypothetical protein
MRKEARLARRLGGPVSPSITPHEKQALVMAYQLSKARLSPQAVVIHTLNSLPRLNLVRRHDRKAQFANRNHSLHAAIRGQGLTLASSAYETPAGLCAAAT